MHCRDQQTSVGIRTEYRSVRHESRLATALLTLLIVGLTLTPCPSANATPAARRHAGIRLCHTQHRGAACAAVALRPRSLTRNLTWPFAASLTNDPAIGGRQIQSKQPIPSALSPQRLATAYSLPPVTTSSALQTIAIVDAYNDPSAEGDLAVYDKQYGLPPCTKANGCLRTVNQEGNPHPLPPTEGAWAAEISADVQIGHAICQNCRILLVEAQSAEFSDLGTAVNTAVRLGATEVNNSYESEGEEAATAAVLNATYYNHPGVVVTASAGDCGYLGQACGGSGVSFPASSPDVVAVGGTALAESSGIWASLAWSESGGGCRLSVRSAIVAVRECGLGGNDLRYGAPSRRCSRSWRSQDRRKHI